MTDDEWSMLAIGNGETVKCKHCDFEFVMDIENHPKLFTHTHKGVGFFDLWELKEK